MACSLYLINKLAEVELGRFTDAIARAIPNYSSRSLNIWTQNKGRNQSRADDDAFYNEIEDSDLLALYKRGLGRKIVNKQANDTFKRWFIIDSENQGIIDAIEEINKEFNMKQLATDSFKRTYLFGYTTWAFGYDDGAEEINEPLQNPREIEYIEILSKDNIKEIHLNEDENDENYGEIDHYNLYPFKAGGTVERPMHASRAEHFIFSTLGKDPYGLSEFEAAYNCLYVLTNNLWSTGQAFYRYAGGFPIITVPKAASNDVTIGEMQDQMANVNTRTGQVLPEGYEMDFKGAQGTALNPSLYFGTVIKELAGIVDIPENILLGLQQGRVTGSDIDYKSYYDHISGSYQDPFTNHFMKIYKRFQDIGRIPEGEFTIKWLPIMSTTELQKATTRKMVAEADKIEIESGVTTAEEIRKRRDEEASEMKIDASEQYACECIKCGHKLTSNRHCADITCPKCGGRMRRAERPGPGRDSNINANSKPSPNQRRSDKLDKDFVNTFALEDRLADDLFFIFEKMRNELIRQVPQHAPVGDKLTDALEDIHLDALEEEFGIVLHGGMDEAYDMGGVRAFADVGAGAKFAKNAPAINWLKTHSLILAGKETAEFVEGAKVQILLGIDKGEGIAKISRRITDVFDITRQRSTLIARTEVIRALNEGRINGYAQMGVAKLEFLTSGSDRVCPECMDLEGNIYTIEESRGMLPIHPACRCTFVSAGRRQT